MIRTGVANLASVLAGLARAGAEASLVASADEVERASHVLLPGVGSFAPGMAALREAGLAGALRARIAAGRPTLAICLGLQMLAEGSEEAPGVPGLGVMRGVARRFSEEVTVPQLGWNLVEGSGGLIESGYAYFANSYRIVEAPDGWTPAWTDHGGRFCAGLQRGAVLACQFHPELSGPWGLGLLGRWLRTEAAC